MEHVFDLARRTGTDPWDLITELAPTDDEARVVCEVLDELEAPESAHELAVRRRQEGHTL